MTTMTIVFVCLGGIVACAMLIFAVETVVAFGFHRLSGNEQHRDAAYGRPISITSHLRSAEEGVQERAA